MIIEQEISISESAYIRRETVEMSQIRATRKSSFQQDSSTHKSRNIIRKSSAREKVFSKNNSKIIDPFQKFTVTQNQEILSQAKTPGLQLSIGTHENLLEKSHLSESFDYDMLNQSTTPKNAENLHENSNLEDSLFDQVAKNQNFEKSNCDQIFGNKSIHNFESRANKVESENNIQSSINFDKGNDKESDKKLMGKTFGSQKTTKTETEGDYVNVEQILEDIMENGSQDSMLVLGNQAFLVESGITGQAQTIENVTATGTGANGQDENTSKRANKSSVISPNETPDIEFLKPANPKFGAIRPKDQNGPIFPAMNVDLPTHLKKASTHPLCVSSAIEPIFQSLNQKPFNAGSQGVSMRDDAILRLTQDEKTALVTHLKDPGNKKLNFDGIDPSTLSYLIWETENEKHDMTKKMKMLDQKLEIMKNFLPESKKNSPVESNQDGWDPKLAADQEPKKSPEVLSQVLPCQDPHPISNLKSVESVLDVENSDPAGKNDF